MLFCVLFPTPECGFPLLVPLSFQLRHLFYQEWASLSSRFATSCEYIQRALLFSPAVLRSNRSPCRTCHMHGFRKCIDNNVKVCNPLIVNFVLRDARVLRVFVLTFFPMLAIIYPHSEPFFILACTNWDSFLGIYVQCILKLSLVCSFYIVCCWFGFREDLGSTGGSSILKPAGTMSDHFTIPHLRSLQLKFSYTALWKTTLFHTILL